MQKKLNQIRNFVVSSFRNFERLVSLRPLLTNIADRYLKPYQTLQCEINRHDIRYVELRADEVVMAGSNMPDDYIKKLLLIKMMPDLLKLIQVRKLENHEKAEPDMPIDIYKARMFVGAS